MEVLITATGFSTLTLLKSYMRRFLEEAQLNNLLKDLVTQTREKLLAVPERPVCTELASIGIFDYRQLNILDHYKVLYRVEGIPSTETPASLSSSQQSPRSSAESASQTHQTRSESPQIFIIAFMRQKQSAQKLLVDMMLLA